MTYIMWGQLYFYFVFCTAQQTTDGISSSVGQYLVGVARCVRTRVVADCEGGAQGRKSMPDGFASERARVMKVRDAVALGRCASMPF